MGIGAYRHHVTLEHPSAVLDPPDWYCVIQSAATQVIDGQTAFFVRGRYHPGLTLETQIFFEGRTFQVQSVTDVDERHVEIVLMCVEVVGRGETRAVWSAYQQRVLADGASAYWPLDDRRGTQANNMATSNPGTISGGVTLYQPGIGTSKAMTFNGTSGKIVTAANVTVPIPCTYEIWVRRGALGGLQALYGTTVHPSPAAQDRFALKINSGGYLLLYVAYGAGADSNQFASIERPILDTTQWHQVTLGFPGALAVNFYVDGQAAAAGTTLLHPLVGFSLRPFEIAYASAWPDYMNGALQDVAIYPRALTPAEIAAHYALGAAR